MDLNLLLKICALIVLAGIAFKLLKVFTSIIFFNHKYNISLFYTQYFSIYSDYW